MSVPRPAMLVETTTGAFAAGLRDDLRFPFMIFGVENFVADAHLLQDAAKLFRLFDGNGADEDGLSSLVALLNFLGSVAEFLFLGAIDDVVEFLAQKGFVGGNQGDFELVNFVEFGGFGVSCTGHTGQLLYIRK